MRKTGLLLFAYLILYTHTNAQEVEKTTVKKNNSELGFFGQITVSDNKDKDINLIGIQYKKWHNEHFGWRALLAYGGGLIYSDRNDVPNTHPGMLAAVYNESAARMAIAGFGVEIQKRFYKRLILFGAIEARLGYGKIKEEKHEVRYDITGHRQFVNYAHDHPVLYYGLPPTLGFKLQFDRVNFGLEGSVIQTNITHYLKNKTQEEYIDFNMLAGNFVQRAFIGFKLGK